METAIDVDKVIHALGGPAKVAELCGIGTVQAVSMWSTRKKIPAARLMFLKLARPDVFEKLGAGETAPVEPHQEAPFGVDDDVEI